MYDRILTAARSAVWAIEPNKLDEILLFLDGKAAGLNASADTIEAYAAANRNSRRATSAGTVGVLPILGAITQRASLMTDASGGASTERIGKEFDAMVNNADVSAIVLDIDSPGGTVSGVPELADKIYAARGTKPIIAVSNTWMTSAAYYLGSQADEVVVSPSSQTGSIGVRAVHADVSEMNAGMGVKYTHITYGENKGQFSQDEPLSDPARAEIQKMVDHDGVMFDKAVARGRGITPKRVSSQFGQGKIYAAEEAVSIGMADRVDTLQGTITRLQGGKPRRNRFAAQAAARRLETGAWK